MIDLLEALNANYNEVSYDEFYRDIFPIGSFEKKGEYVKGGYNGIAVAIGSGEKSSRRYTVTDDLEVIDELAKSDDFCIMSPISYAGKRRISSNARFMYAMAIDLDGVETLENWMFLKHQIDNGHNMKAFVWGLPVPTYMVSSGTGIHLYYVFEKPVPLFSNIVDQLETLKRRITWQAWTQGASKLSENVQYESLFQGFRMVGTITKKGKRCRAFKVGNKVSLEYLNDFVPDEYQVKDIRYRSELTLQQAKEKYPEWYQSRIVEKKPKKTWICKSDLYYWWIRTLKAGAQQGHRYWCIMTLATYAKKCGIDEKQLEEDAYGLIPFMNSIGDEFTEGDVQKALEAFNDSYFTYPIDTISNRTGIKIEKNKRNGRKQSVHLGRARAVQQFDDPDGIWRNKDGAPKKKDIVQQWRSEHPDGRKSQCIRDTGLTKPTVYKWWDPESEAAMQDKTKKAAQPVKTIEQLVQEKKEKLENASNEQLKDGVLTVDDALDFMRMIQNASDPEAEFEKIKKAIEKASEK